MATRIFIWIPCIAAVCSTSAVSFAQPRDPAAELEPLSRASLDVAPGLALARKQIASNDLIGAMATLERLLINHPESDEALLLHASLVCRVDDPEGALIEFDELRGRDFPDPLWTEATAPCDSNSGSSGSKG